jgi:hypothetical protein
MPVTGKPIGSNVRPHHYRIIISGRPDKLTRAIFEDLCVEDDGANTGLTGELDQAALYGVLNRILAFGLELVALSRLDDESPPRLAGGRRLATFDHHSPAAMA